MKVNSPLLLLDDVAQCVANNAPYNRIAAATLRPSAMRML